MSKQSSRSALSFRHSEACGHANVANRLPLADLRLQQMLTYSQQRKILEQHHELIHAARLRGNLIHAFATHGFDNRELGTAEEYLLSIRDFRDFLEDVLTYVPWPD